MIYIVTRHDTSLKDNQCRNNKLNIIFYYEVKPIIKNI